MHARKMSFTAGLLEQSNQLGLFGEEGVMAVGAGHLAVVRCHTRGTDGISKLPHRFRREEPVGTDAHKAEPGLDASEDFLGRRMAAEWIPRFHGSQNGEVGVGVETLNKAASLEIKVAGDIEASPDQASTMIGDAPGIFAIAIGVYGRTARRTGMAICS
jgi:hypothetical protein